MCIPQIDFSIVYVCVSWRIFSLSIHFHRIWATLAILLFFLHSNLCASYKKNDWIKFSNNTLFIEALICICYSNTYNAKPTLHMWMNRTFSLEKTNVCVCARAYVWYTQTAVERPILKANTHTLTHTGIAWGSSAFLFPLWLMHAPFEGKNAFVKHLFCVDSVRIVCVSTFSRFWLVVLLAHASFAISASERILLFWPCLCYLLMTAFSCVCAYVNCACAGDQQTAPSESEGTNFGANTKYQKKNRKFTPLEMIEKSNCELK